MNCADANPGADAGMYDASEQYKLSTITKNAKGEKGLKIRAGLARPPFRAMLERKHFFQKPFPYIIYIKNEIATLSDTKFSIPPPFPNSVSKKINEIFFWH